MCGMKRQGRNAGFGLLRNGNKENSGSTAEVGMGLVGVCALFRTDGKNELGPSSGIGVFPLKKAGMLLDLGGSGIHRLPLPQESLPSLLDPSRICPCPNSPTTANPTQIQQLSLSPIPEEAKPGSLSCASGSHLELGKVEKPSKFRPFPQDGKVGRDHSPALSQVGTQHNDSQLSSRAPSQPEPPLDNFSRIQEPVFPHRSKDKSGIPG